MVPALSIFITKPFLSPGYFYQQTFIYQNNNSLPPIYR
ncbi:hypothetical protein YpsIP31758_1879 [Yersinia pseudotuberculosis IP 31758]|uniref:Uncharacterized protein n=1 Tax=Yersinia pseudotuberculosis serotype O:1b (strain IP 31758) TaxID=349747 RepID=A0A0U1QZJ1_YERP3|nr:hypothetical protein YpsIP31758_1879 [Yersinia pseudotuberculosis IP 31758]